MITCETCQKLSPLLCCLKLLCNSCYVFRTQKIKCCILGSYQLCRAELKCDSACAETRFLFSVKRTSPFKSAGASVQSTTGSRGVSISGSKAGYTMFRGGVKGTGYPLHSPVSPSLPRPCITVCHHISTGVYSQATTFPEQGFGSCFWRVVLKKIPV